MNQSIVISPEILLNDWFDPLSSLSTEDQIVSTIVNKIDESNKDTFFNGSLGDIPNPEKLKDIDKAVDLLINAIIDNQRIMVVGDYDVDGITSTALLLRFFKRMSYENFDYFIPNRFTHGYGLTEKTVDIIKKRNPDLIITVDNGITAKEEIVKIKQYGINVIVTDHHLPQDDLLPNCAVLNPNQNDCEYPYKSLSGVGVVFLLLISMRSRLREMGFWLKRGPEPNLLEQLDLVALGTIADQVPLLGLNRIFAKFGLNEMTKRMHETNVDEGFSYIKAFAEKSKIKSFNSETIAFQLAPMLNATGRMKDAEEGLNFLMSEDFQTALSRYQYLERLNIKRRKKQQTMSQKAMKIAQKLRQQNKGIVVYNESFHEGLIGIIASHLVDRLHYPAAVLTDGEEGILKGSCRSKNENMVDILGQCESCLIQYGGHANAAGFSLEKGNIERFHDLYTQACQTTGKSEKPYEIKANIEVKLEMMTYSLIDKLKVLEPYGHLNRKPIFYTPSVKLPIPTTMTGKHLKWKLEPDLDLIFWNGVDNLEHASSYDLAFTLGENTFRGKKTRQLIVNTITHSQ